MGIGSPSGAGASSSAAAAAGEGPSSKIESIFSTPLLPDADWVAAPTNLGTS
jgi:hypothetical protein